MAIDEDDPRNGNGEDRRAGDGLRIGADRPRKSTVTSGNASRAATGNVNGIGIATGIENTIEIEIASAIAMVEDVEIVPVRTVQADRDPIRDPIADLPGNVASLRNGVQEAPTENVDRRAVLSRSTIEDTVSTARTDEKNVVEMNIVASIVITEKDLRDTGIIIKATAAAEETTEVVHVVVAAAGTVAISLTFPGAMIVAIRKGHRCRHPSTISTATRWDREYRMSTITMIRHITVTACHREWSEQPLCPHTVYPRLDTMRHRHSKRCPRVRRSQAGFPQRRVIGENVGSLQI